MNGHTIWFVTGAHTAQLFYYFKIASFSVPFTIDFTDTEICYIHAYPQ